MYDRVWESASCSPLWQHEEEKLWNVHSLSLLNSGSSRLPMSFPLLLCFGVNGLKRGGGQSVMTLSSAIFLYSQHLPHTVQWLPSPPWTPKCPGLPTKDKVVIRIPDIPSNNHKDCSLKAECGSLPSGISDNWPIIQIMDIQINKSVFGQLINFTFTRQSAYYKTNVMVSYVEKHNASPQRGVSRL